MARRLLSQCGMTLHHIAAPLLALAIASCVGDAGDAEDGESDSIDGKSDSILNGSVQAVAILSLVNDPTVDEAELDGAAGLSPRVAHNIIAHRDRADRTVDRFGDLKELDDVPYVGMTTMTTLFSYATKQGYVKPSTWTKVGSVPATFRDRYSYGLAHQLVSTGDRLLVATPDGLWSAARADGVFKRIGLAGITVMFVQVDPNDTKRIYAGGASSADPNLATFYISRDGGLTFKPATSSPTSMDAGGRIGFSDLTFVPGKPGTLIANASFGMLLMVSTDYGATWALDKRDNAADTTSYPCHVLALSATKLVQGCEVPLDDAWVGVRTISATDPLDIGLPKKVLANNVAGLPNIGNRRPNLVEPAGSATRFFVGVEGGLYQYDLATSSGTWWDDEPADGATETYVGALWLDSSDATHVVFGGFDKKAGSLALLETHDRGAHLMHRMPKTRIVRYGSIVHDIIAGPSGRFDALVSDMPTDDPTTAATYTVFEITP